jgi:hypothetical protein
LVDDVLNKLVPGHIAVAVDVNVSENVDPAVDQFQLFVFLARHFV